VSSENVELVERFFELFQQGEWKHLELLAEDVVYRPVAEITDAGEYQGRDGYRRYMEDFFDDSWWGELSYEVTSYREHDDNVIARIEMTGQGRRSGADVSARVFAVFTIEDGQIVREEDFTDRDEALSAAGLRAAPSADSQIDTVKRAVDLYNRLPADPAARASSPELADLLGLFDPELEFRLSAQLVDAAGAGDAVKGREPFSASWEDWISAWEEYDSEIVEIVERGERVLILTHDRFRARDGLEVENDGAAIFTFKAGRIVRFSTFMDQESARLEFEAGGSGPG
jgi:steroid delta-isomerase-like uncharacterized protein